MIGGLGAAGSEPIPPVNMAVKEMPAGYHLQAYDDCGVAGRQPHVRGDQLYTFTAGVEADERARSVAYADRQVEAHYEGLDPQGEYILAVTYVNERFNTRVQSLWAGSIQLHGPHTLPKGKGERLLLRVPAPAIENGTLSLQFKLEGENNVVVSAIELWAPAPSPKVLNLGALTAPYCKIEGNVSDLAWKGVGGATVRLKRAGTAAPLATVQTDADGAFCFERAAFESPAPGTDLQIVATKEDLTASRTIPAKDLYLAFEPVRYRPMPAAVGGLKDTQASLDGAWRINLNASDDVREEALESSGWGRIDIPGQWLQQGYDVPLDQSVAMAKEFEIPAAWQGYRIILRFDAIHAGTHYWLNGKPLGYSENLFTPVEWDITEAARPGRKNRLDLRMIVATASERLSFTSKYAFHSLGGIDRSVRLFTLPPVHVRSLHLATDLDADYRDADLQLAVGLENADGRPTEDLALELTLCGADGKPVSLSKSRVGIGSLPAGSKSVDVTTRVANPLKWNAEQPNLYRLSLALKQNGKLLQRIERNVGFRKIEIRDRQLHVNGTRVKLAGAGRLETDPLTGRANTMRHAEPDVTMLKEANLNYIRGTHSPPCQELLDAADRLGMYVEVEAPFCWVEPTDELTELKEVLTPTSAMIDYCHSHPSVFIWSIANESHLNKAFEVSNGMVHDLDPTRPTTFNHPFSKEAREKAFDLLNRHYPDMPYDALFPNDPHPLILGEYWFPICHEQTDVRINPGLRELWGHGHAEPDSDWGRACAAVFKDKSWLHPGTPSGAWTHIINSRQLVGGAMFASCDEPFYFANGKHCGYAWVHGFWGLTDAWRRPKPEWWLAKLIFSPVWFPLRHVDFKPGQKSIGLPVENRYSFTNLSELDITWEHGRTTGKAKVDIAPWAKGELKLPVPEGTAVGDTLLLTVTDKRGRLVNTLKVHLGKAQPTPLPVPKAGAPRWKDDGKKVVVEGEGFALVLNRSTGGLDAADPRHKAAVVALPTVHITRFDFGDLAGPNRPPYAVLPDAKTRAVDGVTVEETPHGLAITIAEHYDIFKGTITWLIDKNGAGKVSYDYIYTGEQMNAREVGIRMLLEPQCDELKWRRWSEWDVFPADSICRTEGTAKARRDDKIVVDPEGTRPDWPWSQDQTELGTADFCSVKFNIYEASVSSQDGTGVRVHANANKHLRCCLAQDGVRMHILSECKLGQVVLKPGDHVRGECIVEIF